MIDDELLVRAAQSGNVTGFNQLVEKYQVPLYNFTLRYVSDPQLAEDVTQEAFTSAWRAIQSFKGGSFKAWLFRIAINEARDLHRGQRRRPASSLDEMIEAGTTGGAELDHSRGPEETAISLATLRTVQTCLQRLPEDARAIILLSDVQGMPYEEIAESLGLPLGTVKSRLFRARIALRKLLIESGELSRGG